MRIFERFYFGFCWNLEISSRVIISWRILLSFRGFLEDYIFACWKYLSFHDSSFALRYFCNVNGKATLWHTPCWGNVFWRYKNRLANLVKATLEKQKFPNFFVEISPRKQQKLVSRRVYILGSFPCSKAALQWLVCLKADAGRHIRLTWNLASIFRPLRRSKYRMQGR